MLNIKYILGLVISLLLFNINILSQDTDKQSYIKGGSVIMIGYGLGNIWKTFLNDAISSSIPGITYKVTSTGPVTLVYEYGILRRISAGIALAYSKVKGRYSGYGDEFIDELTVFSALARANYHFGKSEKFDPYVGAGIGYVNSKYSNDQSATRNKVPGTLGYSGQLGARYYFNTSLGVYAEIGYVGGSFGQLGITVKL